MNLNKVFLIGRLTHDVDFRYLPSGTAIATLNLATNRIYKDRTGNLKEEVEYHRVIAWGKLAELCRQHLSKGRLIFVEGRIRSRTWLDAEGNKRISYEIIAENIRFIFVIYLYYTSYFNKNYFVFLNFSYFTFIFNHAQIFSFFPITYLHKII